MKARDISIQMLLNGDRRTATLFYRTFAPKLFSFIQKKVENDKDGEEILQDTLFAFLEGIRDFHGSSTLETYLFAICQHKIIDYYRKKKIAQVVFSKIPSLENLISPLLTPEEEFDAASVRLKVGKTLQKLLPQYQEVIKLKYLEGLGVSEIARKLTVSLKGAEMKLFRARKAFVEAFISI